MDVTLFVDFDGTITERDLLDRIAQTFGDPDVYREVDERLDEGTITLHEVLRREFEPVRAPLDDVVSWVLERAKIRPGFAELVAHAEDRGWRIVVVSSGFRELILPVLSRAGLERVELLSNAIEPDPAGWRVLFRDDSPCEVCGEPCKRATVLAEADDGLRVYIGDGFSDLCGARVCDLVFARRRLAAHLTEVDAPFQPFDDFHGVAAEVERLVSEREFADGRRR
jgi:2,3-diketo-5-methylthio-1-phosphopentane phosphatase